MAKYNISETKEIKDYSHRVNPQMMDLIREQIMKVIVMDRKYLDKDYTERDLAKEIGTNASYVSAVIASRFRTNYTSFVNQYRIEEAMSILVDRRYMDLTIEEVGYMAGFSNRQSFYVSFYKNLKMTPVEYRKQQQKKTPVFDT